LSDCACDQVGIREPSEWDEEHAVSKFTLDLSRDPNPKPRLADATGTGEREQANAVVAEKLAAIRELALAPDQ
jgi:hypothetical protein